MHSNTAEPELRYEPAEQQESVQIDAAYFEAQALRCRRLARSIGDTLTAAELTRMADEYEAAARKPA